MGIFDKFKKKEKKERTLDLPPPPLPEAPEEDFSLPDLPQEPEPPLPSEKELAPPPIEVPFEDSKDKEEWLEFPEIPEVPHEEPEVMHEEPVVQLETEIPSITLREEREEMPPRYRSFFTKAKAAAAPRMPIPPAPKEREVPQPVMPQPIVRREQISQLFVSMDDYQAILTGLTETRRTLQSSAQLIDDLNKIKNEEDKVFEDWRVQVEDIERKLSFIDQQISKGERA